MPMRPFGLLALLTVLLLAACADEASPVPASTPTPEAEAVSTAAPPRTPTVDATPTPEPTAAPTATRAPEPTSTPTPTRTVTAADVEAALAGHEATWRDLFDILGAAEQACIREGVGEDLDETLDTELNVEAAEENVVIFRCRPPDLADSVFIAGLISSLDVEILLDRQVTAEERRCLEDLVAHQDAAALMEMLAADASSAEAAAFVVRVYGCVPDVLIALVISESGVRVAITEDLDDAALECMREAVRGSRDRLGRAIAGLEEEDWVAFSRTVYGCAPDIFDPGLTGTPAPTSMTTHAPGAGPGRIAFGSDRDGNWEIYAMNADGSGVTRLTDHPGWDDNPSWSPDGGRIAFHSNRDGNWNIYVMNVDGSGVTRLTDHPAGGSSPRWSPDGGRIAFESERDGNWETYVMNVDGSGVTRLTDNPAIDWSPSWSPDGERIAFESDRDGNYEIYVVNVDGSGTTRLTNSPQDDLITSWSPDGERIAFSSNPAGNYDIYVMNVDGSGVTRLTDNPQGDLYPSWSPDGGRIVFQSGGDQYGSGEDLYVMNADGSGVTRLTNVRANHSRPSWSPAATPALSVLPTLSPPTSGVWDLIEFEGESHTTLFVGSVAYESGFGLDDSDGTGTKVDYTGGAAEIRVGCRAFVNAPNSYFVSIVWPDIHSPEDDWTTVNLFWDSQPHETEEWRLARRIEIVQTSIWPQGSGTGEWDGALIEKLLEHELLGILAETNAVEAIGYPEGSLRARFTLDGLAEAFQPVRAHCED